ncbi:MAG: HAMP domain-containing histidine kinase [Elusimicrobia bacterium]|nr:HAMP domain-containing histidine kinase [Elusimicrobiota bacterium]
MLKILGGRFGKAEATAYGAAMALLVAAIDYATGVEVGFSIFYLFPVSFVAWHAGRRWGLAVAALCAVLWHFMEYPLGGRPVGHPAIAVWNAVMRGGYFVLAVLALSRIKESLGHERAVSRLKGETLSFVSHEFGNHLTVLGMATLLLKESLLDGGSATQQKVLETMERTCSILKKACANFLNAARLESGRFALDIRRTELRKLAGEALDAMDLLVQQKKILIERDFPADVVPLRADPDALSLVMTNLIGNAVKYTQEGGRVAIRLAVSPADRSVVVSVEDTGIGMSPEDQRRVCSGFYRTRAGKQTAKGFGVGLKLAKDVLTSHGSRLEVSSELGRGSRFHFRLPIMESEPGREEPAEAVA